MKTTYPAGILPAVRKIFDDFCEPRTACVGPDGQKVSLLTTKVDRWDMRRATFCLSGVHEGEMSMWSVPFEGGVWIANHILSHPEDFTGKTVLDIGSGSGLIAIAAALTGAHAIAVDSSPLAFNAIKANAALNNVSLDIYEGDVSDPECMVYNPDAPEEPDWFVKDLAARADIITAGDVFFNKTVATDIALMLINFATNGKQIFASSGEENLAEYFKGKDVKVLRSHRNGDKAFVELTGPNVIFPERKPAAHSLKSGSYTQQLTRRLNRARPKDA